MLLNRMKVTVNVADRVYSCRIKEKESSLRRGKFVFLVP